ncbi:hypothetical protein HC749_20555 [Arthrobacter sp. S13_S34]|nr:hypothetical protein [Arthrobacter sp. S13_S34]
MTEASVIKDRPAQLRRRPRPAPDETVDPVDYNPATHTPAAPSAAPVQVEATPVSGGGEKEPAEEAAPAAVPAPAAEPVSAPEAAGESSLQAAPAAVAVPFESLAPTPARQTSRGSKAKATTNKKSQRREVTFPLSTRVSQEILDLLYDAQENEGVTLRDAIEQGVRMRWGSNR